MTGAGIEGIDRTVHATNGWIHDINERLGWDNRAKSYRLLRAVLHALRDWLPIGEGANLSAQLPTLLRGVYYEQWRPSTVPTKERDKNTFVARIERAMKPDMLDDPEAAIGAVLAILTQKTTSGEIQDVRNALPKDLRALWPEV
jgi:uncharacterized protein (DUF2267 family)